MVGGGDRERGGARHGDVHIGFGSGAAHQAERIVSRDVDEGVFHAACREGQVDVIVADEEVADGNRFSVADGKEDCAVGGDRQAVGDAVLVRPLKDADEAVVNHFVRGAEEAHKQLVLVLGVVVENDALVAVTRYVVGHIHGVRHAGDIELVPVFVVRTEGDGHAVHRHARLGDDDDIRFLVVGGFPRADVFFVQGIGAVECGGGGGSSDNQLVFVRDAETAAEHQLTALDAFVSTRESAVCVSGRNELFAVDEDALVGNAYPDGAVRADIEAHKVGRDLDTGGVGGLRGIELLLQDQILVDDEYRKNLVPVLVGRDAEVVGAVVKGAGHALYLVRGEQAQNVAVIPNDVFLNFDLCRGEVVAVFPCAAHILGRGEGSVVDDVQRPLGAIVEGDEQLLLCQFGDRDIAAVPIEIKDILLGVVRNQFQLRFVEREAGFVNVAEMPLAVLILPEVGGQDAVLRGVREVEFRLGGQVGEIVGQGDGLFNPVGLIGEDYLIENVIFQDNLKVVGVGILCFLIPFGKERRDLRGDGGVVQFVFAVPEVLEEFRRETEEIRGKRVDARDTHGVEERQLSGVGELEGVNVIPDLLEAVLFAFVGVVDEVAAADVHAVVGIAVARAGLAALRLHIADLMSLMTDGITRRRCRGFHRRLQRVVTLVVGVGADPVGGHRRGAVLGDVKVIGRDIRDVFRTLDQRRRDVDGDSVPLGVNDEEEPLNRLRPAGQRRRGGFRLVRVGEAVDALALKREVLGGEQVERVVVVRENGVRHRFDNLVVERVGNVGQVPFILTVDGIVVDFARLGVVFAVPDVAVGINRLNIEGSVILLTAGDVVGVGARELRDAPCGHKRRERERLGREESRHGVFLLQGQGEAPVREGLVLPVDKERRGGDPVRLRRHGDGDGIADAVAGFTLGRREGDIAAALIENGRDRGALTLRLAGGESDGNGILSLCQRHGGFSVRERQGGAVKSSLRDDKAVGGRNRDRHGLPGGVAVLFGGRRGGDGAPRPVKREGKRRFCRCIVFTSRQKRGEDEKKRQHAREKFDFQGKTPFFRAFPDN